MVFIHKKLTVWVCEDSVVIYTQLFCCTSVINWFIYLFYLVSMPQELKDPMPENGKNLLWIRWAGMSFYINSCLKQST